ncbi:MAG: TonB family protein [Gammaproteobacteria bacterium]|nr:TonB family protein [Gammaproteobacteria bacterium]
MPLDEFKTQVLLLHSEQSTLDNLSSGFSDRYTVHCATSGSEALNTLVETPINVIITAHDLPGMSGLDALREAKKRSPDTIGILLAGNSTRDIQALVGAEEVFQVVSGQITSDGLLQLVDKATRQMRLMALAHSANDTTAGVDEPVEHIIMETSENGSTIISDGTGRLPVLDPKKVASSAALGSRSVDVLVLTKDQEFLETIKDSSRGMHKVYYANTLGQANEAISKHKIGVAVVDAAMVGERIEQLTQHLRKGSPRLVSIVAGRRDDGEMLMDLINRGKVYRFLLKPVSPGRARLAVEASVKHHLEAPDAAFKIVGTPAAASPAPAAAPKAAAKPAPVAPKAAPKIAPPPAPKPAAPAPKAVPDKVSKPPAPGAAAPVAVAPRRPVPADPPLGAFVPEEASPVLDGLGDTFGNDDSSFTETVTGLIGTAARKFSSDRDTSSLPEAPAKEPKPELTAASSGGSVLQNPKVMGIAAALVVVVVGALYWAMSGPDELDSQPGETQRTPSFTESDVDFNNAPAAAKDVDVDALVAEARLARDAGQLFNPVGSNAIELLASAIASDPGNALIAAELDAAVGQALSMAESALLESRLDDAAAALQRVAAVDAQNVRLPFLNAQLSQMQLRSRLDEARVAIRESRFEDAAAALNSARSLNLPDTGEIAAISAELSNARSAQQVDGVLAKAAARLDAGALIRPSNDNARYYYELVLSNDPGNTIARQGLNVIASKLALQARAEIDKGNLDAAEKVLSDAHALDSTNADVTATVTALATARAAVAEQQRRDAAAREAAEQRRIAAEKQAEADREAEAERQAEARRQAAAATVAADAASDRSVPTSNTSTTKTADAEDASKAVDTAVDSGPAEAEAARADTAQPVSAAAQMVAVSSLTRTKYVSPKYPRNAERRNLSGWVDVVFTVTRDGTVSNIEVRNSEPDETFVNAAINAVEKWEFQPVVENGVPIEKKVGVRMMFALE